MARKNSSNLGIKILALVCAIILWIYVYYQEGADGTKEFSGIPVVAQNIPQEMILMGELPEVSITLGGSERVLENITKDNISAFINLSEKDAGFHQIKIETNYPSEVSLDKISPKTVSIDLQEYISTVLDIQYEFVGEAQVGLNISDPQVEPEKIKISGPYSIISTLKNALVTVDLTNSKPGENIEQLPFKLITNTNDEFSNVRWKTNNISAEFQKVSVSYTGDLKISTHLIPTILKTSGNIPNGYIISSMDWEPKALSVRGDYNTLKDIKGLNTNPLNLNGITMSNTYTLSVPLPEGAEFVDQKTVKAKLVIEKLATKTLYNLPVQVNPNNVLYNLDSKTVDLIIRGPESVINKALGANVIIDITDLKKGFYTLEVEVTGLPSDVYLVTVPTVGIKVE
ncbi:MAG: CdaR family protein [Caldisericia bacterium]